MLPSNTPPIAPAAPLSSPVTLGAESIKHAFLTGSSRQRVDGPPLTSPGVVGPLDIPVFGGGSQPHKGEERTSVSLQARLPPPRHICRIHSSQDWEARKFSNFPNITHVR